MAVPASAVLFVIVSVLLLQGPWSCAAQSSSCNITQGEEEFLQFGLNLVYLEAEFFLFGSKGYGLDRADPNLTMDGPRPIGAMVARLDSFTKDVIYQFGLQKVGHIRFSF